MSRFLLATAVALFAAAVASAQLTDTESIPPPPLVVGLLPAIGDEGFQKELKLSADQTKRLLAFRQKQWDAEYTTPAKDLKPDELNKAAEAEFTAVLSAEQLRRAKQVAAQIAWNADGFGSQTTPATHVVQISALRQRPEIAAILKLDEAQKKSFTASGGYRYGQVVYLTPAQTAAAKEWLGPPLASPLTYQYDPRTNGRGFGGPGGTPLMLQYTASPDVQKELKLTADQIAALDELRKKYPTGWGRPGGFNQTFDTNLSVEGRQKASEKLSAETTAAVEKVLTAEQRTRLDQLPRQGSDTRFLFLEGNSFGKDLNVTAAQRKACTEAEKAHDAAVAKAVLADEPLDQVKAKVAALDKEEAAAIEALLTPAQQAKRKELVGAEFKGRLTVSGFGRFGGPSGLPPTIVAARERTFGLYAGQLAALARPGVQTELKMTEEQVKKAREASQDLLTKFPRGTPLDGDEASLKMTAAERSAFIKKSLTDILDKGQQARFRELELQQAESTVTGSPFRTTFGAVSYPGVADAIKLTAEQKKKLFASEPSAEVLTAEQKKAIKDMLGKPADLATVFAFPGGPGGTARARATPTLPPVYQLLLGSTLWDEIKLTPEQITKLVPALNEYTAQSSATGPGWGGGFGGGFGGPGGPSTAPDTTKIKAAVESFIATADATLTADQKKRLGQLALQQRAASSLIAVFGVPSGFLRTSTEAPMDVAKELGVTTEQMTKINTVSADAMERANLLGRRNSFTDFANWSEARGKLRDRLDERIVKELTPAQAAKWKEMTGEPYTGFTKSPVPYRNPGGGGFGGNPFAQ